MVYGYLEWFVCWFCAENQMVLVWMWMGQRRMRAGGGLVAVGGLMAESITKVLPLFGWYYRRWHYLSARCLSARIVEPTKFLKI